jgi:type I restriction enzyme S subunit
LIEGDLYNKLLSKLQYLDKKAGKKKTLENQARDVLIAETCIKNNLVLVSDDKNLRRTIREFGGQAITLEQFLRGEYREFKHSEIGEIPEEWEVVRLGDVISLEYGKGLPERKRVSGKYPVYGSNGIVGYHNELLVKGPGIIVGRKGTMGAVSWSDLDFWPIDTTYFVKTKRGDIFLKWLYLELVNLNLKKLALSDVVPGLNRNAAYSLKLSLPSLPEQQKIAEILSAADEKIEIERKRKEKLEELKKGLMQNLLTGKARVKV